MAKGGGYFYFLSGYARPDHAGVREVRAAECVMKHSSKGIEVEDGIACLGVRTCGRNPETGRTDGLSTAWPGWRTVSFLGRVNTLAGAASPGAYARIGLPPARGISRFPDPLYERDLQTAAADDSVAAYFSGSGRYMTSVANAVAKRASGATTSDRADASSRWDGDRHDRPKRNLEGTR